MLRRLLLSAFSLLFLSAIVLPLAANQSSQPPAPQSIPAVGNPPPAGDSATTHATYTLTPEQREKAIAYSNANYRLTFITFFFGLFIFWLVLRFRCAPRIRDLAEKVSRFSFVQAIIFVPLLLLVLAVLGLPTDIYGQWLSRKYDQSIQTWGSWFWDWAKIQFVLFIIGAVIFWILYLVIRRSPRRWWLYFWLTTLPILALLQILIPVLVLPLLYKSVPLAPRQPQLVERIEQVTRRGGLDIPRDRMFELLASEKTKSLNAAVMGFGPSKRVVIFDTLLAKMTTDQTLFAFGHEMGHYVLGHVYRGFAFTALTFLLFFFLSYLFVRGILHRWGQRWGIRSLDDFASLPVILLLLSVFSFLYSPIQNSYTRYGEHEADIYGLEVTHGIIPNAGAVAAQSFQILGESNLADPDPPPFIKVWLYSHPPLNERISFAASYDPWSKNVPRKFIKD